MTILISMIALIILIPFLYIWNQKNINSALESQNIDIDVDCFYQVTWYKQAGQLIKNKRIHGSLLKLEVEKTFARAKDIYRAEVCSDGYVFRRANWRHGRREGQMFGFIAAKKEMV